MFGRLKKVEKPEKTTPDNKVENPSSSRSGRRQGLFTPRGDRTYENVSQPSSVLGAYRREAGFPETTTQKPERPADAPEFRDKPNEISSQGNDSIESSLDTLKTLLQSLIERDIKNYNNIEDLKDAIYRLYKIDQVPSFLDPPNDKEYQQSLEDIPRSEDIQVKIQQKHEGRGYFHFKNTKVAASDKASRRRFSLNVQPDHILQVTKDLVEKVSGLPYVSSMKVAYSSYDAINARDNAIVYFYDSANGANKSELEEILRTYATSGQTRSRLPAMMEPIGRGIAFADQSKGDSWGKTRMHAIAEVAWKLKNDPEMNLETFLRKVQWQFVLCGINPEKPQWNIHNEDIRPYRRTYGDEVRS
jgi:hypothetical protein